MTEETYTIGQLSKRAAVNIQTVRFYEREGMLAPAFRRDSGYRVYDAESLKRLTFIRHAKELGFSLKEINELLKLRVRTTQGCDRVRSKASEKLIEIQKKIGHLRSLEETLVTLISDCEKRVVSDCCPILGKMEK
jgi:MerR family transcriptional regulator, copper efflux regulator